MQHYDEFRTLELDPAKWVIAKLPLGDGRFWEYRDPNTMIRTGDGRCEITVDPFSRSHDAIQVADNPKTLFASAQPIPVSEGETLLVSAKVGAEGHNNRPDDIFDAFVTLNLFDFESGVVIDFLLNGHLIYALYERLYLPGYTDETTAVVREANLPVRAEPRQLYDCTISYDRSRDVAEWRLGGELVYRVPNIPVKVKQFFLGMGLMTIKPIAAAFPYYFPKSTSLHGQGITGIWSEMTMEHRTDAL
jgi:hypothetical protein